MDDSFCARLTLASYSKMRSTSICLLVFSLVAAVSTKAGAQVDTPELTTRQAFNQVFVKVVVPVTVRTPKQNGPPIESWITAQLKERGGNDFFAVTQWVPICDGLLADDLVDNSVWGGGLESSHPYCPVGGDIPERKNGRLLISVNGWLPSSGCGARITLLDEPGNRAVVPVQIWDSKEGKPVKVHVVERLPFVAVIVAPPPQMAVTSNVNTQ